MNEQTERALFQSEFDKLGYQWSEANQEKAFLGWELARRLLATAQQPAYPAQACTHPKCQTTGGCKGVCSTQPAAQPMTFGGCPSCGSSSCVAMVCQRVQPAAQGDSVVVPRKLAENCLNDMKYAVRWECDRDGRPPSQICFFDIQDLEELLSAAPAQSPERQPLPRDLSQQMVDAMIHPLAQPEQPAAQGEPIGTIVHLHMPPGPPHWSEKRIEVALNDDCDLPDGTPVYTHPQPTSKPMTDEQDRALCEAHGNAAIDEYFNARPLLDSTASRRAFYAGFRKAWIAERHHNIKE